MCTFIGLKVDSDNYTSCFVLRPTIRLCILFQVGLIKACCWQFVYPHCGIVFCFCLASDHQTLLKIHVTYDWIRTHRISAMSLLLLSGDQITFLQPYFLFKCLLSRTTIRLLKSIQVIPVIRCTKQAFKLLCVGIGRLFSKNSQKFRSILSRQTSVNPAHVG